MGAAASSRLTPNTRGALFMVFGSLGYVVNDALVREATEEGVSVYQALCLRGITMVVLFGALGLIRGERLMRDQLSRPFVARVAAELVATALFFGALVNLEFANAQTILLLVPFAVTLAAAVVLGETVTALHYAAIAGGFIGVLLVVQPATDGFSLWSLAVVVSAAFMTLREFATRRVPATVPTSSIALVTAAALTVLTGFIAIFDGWTPVSLRAALLLVAACLCLVAGYVFSIKTVRVGDLSVSAPFRYTTLIGAVALGYAFFDEIPNVLTVAGCVVIVLAGLSAIHLERRTAAAARLATLDRTGL